MSGSLRIIHCFRSPVGGIFRHVRDLAVAQAAAGHKVGIICDSSTGGALEDRYFDELRHALELGVSRMPIQRRISIGDIAAGVRTFRLLKELRPDVLHGHGAKGGALVRVFGSVLRVFRYRVARVYSPHGGVLHYDPATRKGRLLFSLERLLTRLSDHILFVSEHERQAFFAKVGRLKTPTSMFHNGVNGSEFIPVENAPDAADFIYIGMMRDLKGPDIFLDALAFAEKVTGRRLRAVMVGDGPDLPRYQNRAKTLGIDVTFFPPMPAREAFALGRTVVVPSRAEAMPYLVLEALAAGKPMIATAVGGIPEVFGADSPALVMPEPPSVGDAMVRVLADEAAYRGVMPSREELIARFSVETMAANIETVYRSCLAS
ncbi:MULTISPECIES: glycosyltransferase family 4 protein [unclassified Aminobacter]|uniref:glycosyltransferase family 4 protein n=1 Tax=unclassified Aminobacter TaxID=2644704 RepID=UPI00046672FA|nr:MULTISPECIES: glycosyltransferase family 4 protein [unclassified Aminobacter]TWG67513.1 glycosyltransferase involved in cell wall biosynthesis [Aminobacter sp. J44]TWH35623.1 glycosyltransferase involved in cell wall biosynthesis [Aminobacter sp. J15]